MVCRVTCHCRRRLADDWAAYMNEKGGLAMNSDTACLAAALPAADRPTVDGESRSRTKPGPLIPCLPRAT